MRNSTILQIAVAVLLSLGAAAQDNSSHDKNSGFDLSAALMSNMPFIKDDNPAGFTQTYIRLNFKRHCRTEWQHAKSINQLHIWRNLFGQVLYSANAEELPTVYRVNPPDSTITRYYNKIDLLQRASVNLTMLQNLVTFLSYDGEYWRTSIYLDALATYLRTNVLDSTSGTKKTISSWMFGANLKGRFKSTRKFLNLPFAIETSGQIFWINPISNFGNFDLNTQYVKKGDLDLPINKNKPFTVDPQIYYRVSLLAMYELSKEDTKDAGDKRGNTIFISLNYTSNLATASVNEKKLFNNFFQAQIGVSLSITDAIKSISDKTSENPNPVSTPANH